MTSAQPQIKTEPTNEAANIISALGKAFKGQNGAPLTGDQLAQWLHQNMAQLTMLVKEGKLTQGQILAVRNRCRIAVTPRVQFRFVRDLWLWIPKFLLCLFLFCDHRLTQGVLSSVRLLSRF